MPGELLKLAVTNLGRARARLMMTAGGVVVGTAAVILLIALTFGLQKAAEAGIGNSSMLTQIDVYPMWGEPGTNMPQLNDETVRTFWNIPGVRFVQPVVRLQGGELRAGDFMGYGNVIGIDPRLLPYMNLVPQFGELSLENGLAVTGATVGQNFMDPEAEEYMPVEVDMMQEQVELVLYSYMGGTRKIDLKFSAQLVQSGGYSDFTIYMAIDRVRELNEWVTGQDFDPKNAVYDEVTVYATNRETVTDVSAAIREMGFGVGGMGEYLNSINSFFLTMRVMLGAVGGIALLVAAFGIANTMMMAILERTREIGIMKAIGATNESILLLFLLESGLVGLVGGVIGVLVAQGLANLVNSGLQNMPQSQGGMYFLPIDPNQLNGELLVIPPELWVFAIVLATGVGIVAGLYPSARAAQMPPVIALKHD